MSDVKVWVGGIKSGHCLAGNHEGTRNLSPKGALHPACSGMGGLCTCDCHPANQLKKMHDFIAQQLGAEAAAALPSAPALVAATDAPPILEAPVVVDTAPAVGASPGVGLPPDHTDDVPKQLESGRRARGSLDYEVKQACDRWLSTYGTGTNGLTPQVCAKLIDPDNPPSSGAVDAVWRRWVALGFAVVGRGPVHFQGYTPAGVEKGLHRMKWESKRRKQGHRS